MTLTRQRRTRGRVRWQMLAAGLSAVVLFAAAGCEPDIGNDPVPSWFIFDTATGQVPEPTIAAVSQTTGYLDFTALGYNVPVGIGACIDAPGWPSVAECEFFQYLHTLDGYPTLSSMRCPASAPLDPTTLSYDGSAGDTVVVLENGMRKITAADGLVVQFNANDNYLYMDNPAGWEVGATYIGGVRGYDDGVVTTDGTRVVAPVIYNLLKREESLLDCAPDAESPPYYDAGAQVDDHCKYYHLVYEMFAADFPDDPVALDATVRGLLASLESLRQGYKGNDGITGMWDLLAGAAGAMDKAEAAIAWAWPVHSQSVIENQPVLGMVPVPEGNDTLRVRFKGSIDASSLVNFTIAPNNADVATTFLLNGTAFLDNDLVGAFPAFTSSVEGDEIVLTAAAPLVVGDRYVIMFVSKAEGDNRPADFCGLCDGPVTDLNSRPFVASPLTVYLRSRGPLADIDGNSLVSKLDGPTAVAAEEGRQDMAVLLDNVSWPTLTQDLIRENVIYVYAFDYVAP